MAVYRLDVEKRFGQFLLRLYPQGVVAPAFGAPCAHIKALTAELAARLDGLALGPGGDSVVFRNIAYDDVVALRETVRLSRY
jgi:hypothetical protein